MDGGRRLTDEQLKEFYDVGCIGPFPLEGSPEELEEPRKIAATSHLTVNPIYEMPIGRDLHLVRKPIYDLFTRPEIKEKVVQLLGPDLILWRSDVFPKPPGSLATPWHQADVFTEFTEQPLLESPDYGPNEWGDLWQVTVWFALEDATVDNGCLEIIPGTHREQLTWPIRGEEARRYVADTYSRGMYPDPDRCIKQDPKVKEMEHRRVKLEAKAGQYYIFTQRVIHGSGANTTDNSRLAINCRLIKSNIRCYKHYLPDGKWEMLGLVLPLHNWGCLAYAGSPDPSVNRVLPPPA